MCNPTAHDFEESLKVKILDERKYCWAEPGPIKSSIFLYPLLWFHVYYNLNKKSLICVKLFKIYEISEIPLIFRCQQNFDQNDFFSLCRSANLLTVTPAENNWVTILCVLPHPKCAKWVYTVMILGGILLARNSRDTEVSAFSQAERQHGCGQDRYCLGAESALRISLAFFVSTKRIYCSTLLFCC
jgi:hypothetical protein